jgi:hypothetical protein
VVELDLAPHVLLPELARAGRVGDVVREVEVGEDPLEERERRLHLDRRLEHVPDREQEAGLQRGERDDRAEREVRVAGDEEDQRRRRREEHLDEGEERAADHLLAHLEPGEPAVAFAVALDRVALPIEGLREQHARDGERLLGQRGELRERLLRLLRELPPRPADAPGEEDEDRHDGKGEGGQLPGEEQHRNDGAKHGDDVREHRGRCVRDDVLHAADVVLEAGLEVAGARAGEEAERHRLEVLVEAVPQVLHHALADDGRQVGLPDADRARDERDRDHQDDELPQQVQVVREQRPVDDRLRQEGGRDSQRAGDEDRPEDEADLRPVGLEEPSDAPNHAAQLTFRSRAASSPQGMRLSRIARRSSSSE